MNITLYSKPNCVQCVATKRNLDKAGLTYTTVDISKDIDALERIMSMGFQQAPVMEIDGLVEDTQTERGVTVSTNMWSGFRPDLLVQLTQ